jgi:hypothetical protein
MGALATSDAAAQALAFDRGRKYVDNLDAMQVLAPIVRRAYGHAPTATGDAP